MQFLVTWLGVFSQLDTQKSATANVRAQIVQVPADLHEAI